MTTPRVPPGPPTSLLRVYEPLSAFGDLEPLLAEQARQPVTREQADLAEREASWQRVVRGHGGQADDLDVVRFRVVEGAVLACPVQVRLRCAAAAREAIRVLPAPVVAAALGPQPSASETPDAPGAAGSPQAGAPGSPQNPARPAPGAAPPGALPLRPSLRPRMEDAADLPSTAPTEDLRLRTLVAGWELPWAWLALVSEEDRGPGGDPIFLVPMAKARTRAARARKAVREAAGDIDLLRDIEEVGRWLEDFHPRSWVELDVREVAAVLAADASASGGPDTSTSNDAPAGDPAAQAPEPGRARRRRTRVDIGVEDVALGLESLAAGDATAVAAAYRRLTARWQRLQALARAS